MISERKLATGFASLWHNLTPMADTYWRTQNLYVSRFARPVEDVVPPNLRAFASELAFETFFQQASNPFVNGRSAYDIARFSDGKIPSDPSIRDVLTEALALCDRLTTYFRESSGREPFVIRPDFPGCGFIDKCQGDVIEADTLYEVKAVERSFRISDLRQLIIYASLARSSRAYHFERLGLINPRTGCHWVRTVDEISYSIAGCSGVELLDNLIESISSPVGETQ